MLPLCEDRQSTTQKRALMRTRPCRNPDIRFPAFITVRNKLLLWVATQCMVFCYSSDGGGGPFGAAAAGMPAAEEEVWLGLYAPKSQQGWGTHGSTALPGAGAATQPRLQTYASLHSQRPRKPPLPLQAKKWLTPLPGLSSLLMPTLVQSKVVAQSRHCHNPARCVHALDSADGATPPLLPWSLPDFGH